MKTQAQASPFITYRLVNIMQAAVMINCDQSTIRRWIRKGILPYYRRGKLIRISMNDVHALLYKGTAPPTKT